MAKTRLNSKMRNLLHRLADERVKVPEADKAFELARKRAQKELLRCIQLKYPKKDMEVLDKYHKAERHDVITFIMTAHQNRYGQFTLDGDLQECPLLPGGGYQDSQVPLDEAGSNAVNEWLTADAARHQARAELLATLDKAIEHSKYLEDIEAVWPVAREARRYAPANLPVVQLADTYDKIREAVEAKLA